MIFTTGDLHGNHDYEKFNRFKSVANPTKDDYVIVAGDFGVIWDGSKRDINLMDKLQQEPFTTLWVDGNHENFNLIKKYPVQEWNGGKVQFIRDDIIHLMRGQIYTIGDTKIFTMGGAESIDKDWRTPGKSWWAEEIPSPNEILEATENLMFNNWKVDYIITHTCPSKYIGELSEYKTEDHILTKFLDMVEENVEFKHWYFGHFHQDRRLDDKHTCLYWDVREL